jgi:hypothetical protein
VKNNKPLLLSLFVVLGLLGVGAGCTTQAVCAKTKECASDPPGEEFERICVIEADGMIKALRANKEEECHILADAYLAFWACTAQQKCSDFEDCRERGDPDDCDECEDVRRDLDDAKEDADDECSARD